MNSFFKFSERGTSLRTESVAGLMTSMTIAYIVFVNPAILGTEGTGLSIPGVFFATCVAAAATSIAMSGRRYKNSWSRQRLREKKVPDEPPVSLLPGGSG